MTAQTPRSHPMTNQVGCYSQLIVTELGGAHFDPCFTAEEVGAQNLCKSQNWVDERIGIQAQLSVDAFA